MENIPQILSKQDPITPSQSDCRPSHHQPGAQLRFKPLLMRSGQTSALTTTYTTSSGQHINMKLETPIFGLSPNSAKSVDCFFFFSVSVTVRDPGSCENTFQVVGEQASQILKGYGDCSDLSN